MKILGVNVTASSDWPAIFSPNSYNWVDLTLVCASVEASKYMRVDGKPRIPFDSHFALLGFHVFASNVYGYGGKE